MQRIETSEQKEKREKRRQMITGVVLVVILLLSTAGYSIMDRSKENAAEKERYNNFEFVSSGELWRLQGSSLSTRYLPGEVENISYSAALQQGQFAGRDVYFVAFSEGAKIAANEIARNLPALRFQLACLPEQANMSECADLPVKNCGSIVLAIDEKRLNNTSSMQERIYQQENCIFLEVSTKNLIRAADRVLFGIYGVM